MSTMYVDTITPNSGDTVTISGSLTTTGKLTIGDQTSDTVSFVSEISSSLIPDANNTYDLGSSGNQWKNLYIHETASLDGVVISNGNIIATGNGVDSGIISGSSMYIGGSGVVSGTLHVHTTALIGHLNMTGGRRATFESASFASASFDFIKSNIIPDANNTYDLGSSTNQWKDLHIDGTASINTANIYGSSSFHGPISGNLTPYADDDFVESSVSGTLGTRFYRWNHGYFWNVDTSKYSAGTHGETGDTTNFRCNITIGGGSSTAPVIRGVDYAGQPVGFTMTNCTMTASNITTQILKLTSSILPSVDGTHLGSADGYSKFTVQGQLQAAVADGATSAEFTVGNTNIALGDVIFGTAHGALMGGLSQSNMIITTRTANSMSFVFNNESGLAAVDDSAFTASFAIIK